MLTSLYASLLCLFFIFLSVRVIVLRGNPVFAVLSFGKDRPDTLDRAIRAHGNFAEYTPLFLILLYLAERSDMASSGIHAYAASFFAGRLMHGICFALLKRNLFLRVGGTVLTLFPLLGLASWHLRSLWLA
tara:strand:+ start:83 stop:475 length:393 start_codon:yes stop_codon:yes gene_type:complete